MQRQLVGFLGLQAGGKEALMAKHNINRRAVLERMLESVTGAIPSLLMDLLSFVEQEDLPAIAVWLTDAHSIQAL